LIPPSTQARAAGTKSDAEANEREGVTGIALDYPGLDFAPHTTPLKVD